MSSKDIIRAGESGGRRAAIREVVPKTTQELLPSHIPLPKPTRDISASNRSHSIIHQESPQPYSDRRILDRDTEEFEYQKQANIVYNRQFKSLAKLLGNQSMDFGQVKQRIQSLLLKESSNSEADLKYKIQLLEKELSRKEDQRSSQYLGNSEYIKTMEAQLSRKNRLISQLSDSVKKEAYHEAFKQLQIEVSSKERDIIAMQQQIQSMRVKSATQISTLEQQIIKRNQNIQKLNFELESLKRKLKAAVEQNERSKKREKDLLLSFQTEAKVNYQGITYSALSLLKQLQTKDQELHEVLGQHHALEEEQGNLKDMISRLNKTLQMQESTTSQLNASLEYYKSMTTRQNREIEQFRIENNQLKASIQNMQHRAIKDKELIGQLQKREQALVFQCREYENEMKSLQKNSQAITSQLNELSSKGQADKTLIAQLSSAFSQQKQRYTSTLVNFETIQQKLLNQVEARAKLQSALHQKQEHIISQEAHFRKYTQEKQEQQNYYINQNKTLEQQIDHLTQELLVKDRDIASLQQEIGQNIQSHRQQAQEREHYKKANIVLEEEIKHLQIRLAEQNIELQKCFQRIKVANEDAEFINILKAKLEANQIYEIEATHLKETLQQYQHQKNLLVSQYNQIKAEVDEANLQVGRKEEKIKNLNENIGELVGELEHKIRIIEESSRKIQHLQQELEYKQGALDEKTQLSLQIEQQESRYQQTIGQYNERINVLQKQIHDADIYKEKVSQLQEQLEQKRLQLTQVSEDNRRSNSLLDQRIQEQTALQLQLSSLRVTLQQKDCRLQRAQQTSQKVSLLEEQLHQMKSEEAKLRLLLQETAEKETHWESAVQNQRIQIQQLRNELQREKQLTIRERVQMQEKLEIMHEQLDREKAQYQQQAQSRNHLEQQLTQIQRLYKQSDFSRQQIQMDLSQQRNENSHLSSRITEMQALIQDKQIEWLHQKQRLTSQIERLNLEMQQQEKNIRSNLEQLQNKHQEQVRIITTKLHELDELRYGLQQQKNQLVLTVAELQTEKEQIKQQQKVPTLSNDLENCTFDYYSPQEEMVNDSPSREKQILLERIQQLQNQVEQLRHQLEGKSTQLVYSKSQEEQSLKFMISSLQEEKNLAEREIQRLKTEQLTKILYQNQALRNHIEDLNKKIEALQQSLDSNCYQMERHRSIQTFNTQLESLKQSYALTLKDLQNKNQLLLLDLNRFQEKIELLIQQNRLHKEESINEKEQYERKIQSLQVDLANYKKKDAEMTQQLTEINGLLGEIETMKQQMQSFQQQCKQLAAARSQLQLRNAQLQAWNNQLQALLVSQKQEEQQRILSRLSKKSNVSGEGDGKRQNSYSEAPSSDGELSRKILNYDPSKISGQESKFAPHLVFQNSKIHVVREPINSSDPHSRTEIKQQRKQESIVSKNLHERQKSIESSPKPTQERRSEVSRRQTPKQIASSVNRKEQQRQKSNSLKNDQQRGNSDSIGSRKNASEISYPTEPQIQNKIAPNYILEALQKNHGQVPIVPSREKTKQQYLPQHSSKKTVQSNEESNKIPEEETKKQAFHKKSQFQTIVPVYTARPSIIHNLQHVEKRDNSGSRSSSHGKITISYGKPADNSFEKKSIKQVQMQDRRQLSKKTSRVSQIGALGNTSPHEISPISIKRPQAYTPTQSLRQSTHRQGQSQIKLFKQSIVQPVEKIQSQSIINKVNNISVRFSSVAGGRPPPVQTRHVYAIQKQVPAQYIPPKIDTVISPRISNIGFNDFRSSNQLGTKTRIEVTHGSQAHKPDLRSYEIHTERAKIEGQAKQPLVQQTPLKVSMKRVSSGRRLNSGFGDSLTFGVRSRKENDSVASLSSDSGIEVMQYDWTAPCCKP